MTSLLVTGYKSFELGIFKDKDPKVTIIKKAIKRDFKRFLDDGVAVSYTHLTLPTTEE